MDKSKNKNKISRRNFIAMAGGAAGAVALSTMGTGLGWAANDPEIDLSEIKQQDHKIDVLVIGGGMAGLFAAVKAHDAGSKVLMVLKGRFGSSGLTPFGKGVFAYDPDNAKMSISEYVDSVSRSACGTNNTVYTRQLAEYSMQRVKELKEWGFFDSHLYNDAFFKPINQRKINIMERVVVTHLIKEDGRIAGAAGFSLDGETAHFFNARSVILCTGSGGFKPNGFPVCELTHDGTVMAYRIGAKVTGKEWNDGHPGQAANAASCYDGWHGMFDRKPGIVGIGIRHDLGVDLNYRAYMSGNPVQMGRPGSGSSKRITGGPSRPAEFNRGDHPPGGQDPDHGTPGRKKCPEGGGAPPGMAGILVGGSSAGMAIHKSEGIVPINEKCESTIPGLYAAGDALGSHMAGAIYTQIGSSLAGSAVQGAVAGEAASEYCQWAGITGISSERMVKIQEEMFAPIKRKAGYSPAWVTQTLQGIMIPNFVLYIKKESMLKAALAYIEELRDHHMPMLRAADMHELRLAHETSNMIITAEMKLKASLMRKESRCSHYRLDYPEMDNKNWRAWINIYKGRDGSMKFEKQPFGTWPS